MARTRVERSRGGANGGTTSDEEFEALMRAKGEEAAERQRARRGPSDSGAPMANAATQGDKERRRGQTGEGPLQRYE